MRDNLKCNCNICRVEQHLSAALSEPMRLARFSELQLLYPSLAGFASPSMVVGHLHSQREGEERPPTANEILAALIRSTEDPARAETSNSVLVLAFMPAIHRTYSEVRAWFRELPTDDVSQQTLTYFLELASSAPVGLVDGQLSFLLARSLRRNVFRWAQKEMILLREREKTLEELREVSEPSFKENFETVSLLNDFLDFACRKGIISVFERALLQKMKIEGFLAKEAAETNKVLSEKAVFHKLQRIMARLQKAAKMTTLGEPIEVLPNLRLRARKKKNLSTKAGSFSLGSRTNFLAIGKSRRQLSLDSSPKQSESKTEQFAAAQRNLSPTLTTLPFGIRRTRLSLGTTPQRLAAIPSSVFPPTLARQSKSGESLPSNSGASKSRILRKELANHETVLPKKVRDALVSARTRHALRLAVRRHSSLRPSSRWIALGERRQCFDDRVHNHHRSWSLARFHCDRWVDLRLR